MIETKLDRHRRMQTISQTGKSKEELKIEQIKKKDSKIAVQFTSRSTYLGAVHKVLHAIFGQF